VRRVPIGRPVDSASWLAPARGHALAFLAAYAHAGVEGKVVADHAHAREHVRAVADQRGALDRGTNPAVGDPIGLGGGEHELAGGDVDLAAVEAHGGDAVVGGRLYFA